MLVNPYHLLDLNDCTSGRWGYCCASNYGTPGFISGGAPPLEIGIILCNIGVPSWI